MLAYSHSRLFDYAQCPFYFKCRNIDKLEMAKGSDLVIGSVIHDILKEYTMQCYTKKVTHLYDEWEQVAYKVMENYPVSSEVEDEIFKSVKEYIEANEIELEGLAGVEERIAIDNEFRQVDWNDERVWFRAILDKWYMIEDQAKIVDYKTGYSMAFDPFQIECYAWLLFRIYPQLNYIHAQLDYTRFSYKKDWEIKRNDWQKINRKVMNRINKIEEDKEFKPQVSSWCSRCSYWGVCSAIKKSGMQDIFPKSKKEAEKLLIDIIGFDKKAKEMKTILKTYVEEYGDIKVSNMLATNKPVVTKKYNTGEVISWANENGINLLDAISIDSRKIGKIEIPEELYKKVISTRFFIGVNKDNGQKEEKDI